jgi:phosphotransferase system HPr (HPr) family protein
MVLMSLGVKQGDNVKVTVAGEDEDVAVAELAEFFKNNL